MNEHELKNALGQVHLCESGRDRILENSRKRLQRKENVPMKKKTVLVAIAAVCILTVGAVAAGSSAVWYSSSSSRPDYTTPPTVSQMEQTAGFSGIVPEGFSNGYVFDNGSNVSNVLEQDGSREKFESFTMRYVCGENSLDLTLEPPVSTEVEGQPVLTHNGVDLYAHAFINRTVPDDYQMTREDLELEQAGEVYFNCDGEDHTVDHQVRSVSWTEDGVSYNLMQIDGPLTLEELETMTCEIIDAG